MDDVRVLMSTLRDHGLQLWVHNGELRFRCPSGFVSANLLSEMRRFKNELIALLEGSSAASAQSLALEPRPPVLPLSYMQEGLWFLNQLGLLGPAYNFPTILKLEGALDLTLLEIGRAHV